MILATKIGGGWKALLKLSAQLEASATLPHVKLRYAALKIACMMKLIVRNHGLLQLVLSTLAEIGSADDSKNLFESYPDKYPNRKGTMVPFMMMLMECESHYILSKDMSKFFNLHAECVRRARLADPKAQPSFEPLIKAETVLSSNSALPEDLESLFADLDESKAAVWYNRADSIAFSLLTRQVQIREPLLGLQTLGQLLPHAISHPVVIGIIIRLYLLIGDVTAAKKALSRLEIASGEKSDIYLLHRGFTSVAVSEYASALQDFEKVILTDPHNISAVNNAAICHTFLRNATRAVQVLEDALFSRPVSTLNETSVFNLCTLYELLSDKSLERRRKLLLIIHDHAPDHFNLLSLRIANPVPGPSPYPPIQP